MKPVVLLRGGDGGDIQAVQLSLPHSSRLFGFSVTVLDDDHIVDVAAFLGRALDNNRRRPHHVVFIVT
jgi:hypothetical protein